MRLAVVVTVLALAAGCGGSSGTQELHAQPPAGVQSPINVQTPLATAPVAPPVRTEKPSPDAVYSPAPVQVIANPSAAYAGSGTATSGTASSGPGRRSSPPASPSPRPTPSPVAGTVTVTENDSGATVRLTRGQHLRVRVSNGTWDPPVSYADGVVVRRSSAGGYPSDQPVDATFDAVGSGSADVTAQSDAACFHTEPRCMMASRQWQVHVVVR